MRGGLFHGEGTQIILLGLAVKVLSVGASAAGNFRIEIEGMDSGRRPTLVLSAPSDGRYGIEASADLTNWFGIHSGVPEEGVLRFRHEGADPHSVLFYRGIKLSDSTDPEVVPLLDPLVAAATVVTFDEGGAMSMTAPDGTIYTLTVEPGNVVEPVAIGMRLVSGFGLFPYENERRWAVVFEPDGFEFHGAGVLEIRYPAMVDHLKISSFAFNGDGSGFHLVPDTVYPDRVRIPVTHFSGAGAALWKANARAGAIARSVASARDGLQHEMAGKFGQERQRQLLGEEPNPDVFADLFQRMQDYHDRQLQPYFVEARTNCALAKFLSREILIIERQKALLSEDGGENQPSFLGSPEYATWTCNCLNELIKACEEGRISSDTFIKELLQYERTAQLLGVETGALDACGFGSLQSFFERFQQGTLPCVPEWTGHVSYSEGGSRTWDCSGGNGNCRSTSMASLVFEAGVETAEIVEEFSFPPFYSMTKWKLTFHPEGQGAFSFNQQHSNRTECGSVITTTSMKSGSGAGPMTVEMEFTFENGELTELILGESRELEVETVQNTTTTATPCEGETDGGYSHSNTFPGVVFLGPVNGDFLDQAVFARQSATELTGEVVGRRVGIDGIEMPFRWTFQVARQKSGN